MKKLEPKSSTKESPKRKNQLDLNQKEMNNLQYPS